MNNVNKMHVWIFQTGEPMPLVSDDARPMRVMNLTNCLLQQGSKVTIWTSTFSHQSKSFFIENKYAKIRDKDLEIRFIPSPGYKQNLSIARLIDHLILAFRLFFTLRKETEKPDILFIGFPPIMFAYVAFRWGKRSNIPMMLDIKDRWPEVFVFRSPKLIKPIVKIVMMPLEVLVKRMFKGADVISTISDGFLSWIRRYSGREIDGRDKVFYLTAGPDRSRGAQFSSFTENPNENDTQSLKLLFVGSFSASFNFAPILETVKFAHENYKAWEFVFCGHGPNKSILESWAGRYPNLKVMGSIDETRYAELANTADLAIAPYERTPDFQLSIPNKVLDYMSFGLPILTSLDGDLADFLRKKKCGFVYDSTLKHDLCDTLLFLSDNRELLSEYGRNAAVAYESDMGYSSVYGKLVETLKSYTH